MKTAPLILPDGKKMLIIDDENKLLLGLKAVMRREGFDVLTATRGDEGIELARNSRPDIIICDVMMPTPNGFQVKNILAQDPLTSSIPFIFLTARTNGADKIAGFTLGADDYVTKPFSVDELMARVRAILRRIDISRSTAEYDLQEKLEKVRYTIAANMSHEFRTPLGIILSSLELAINDKFHGRMDDLDWYLETSLSNANKLLLLVNDLILLNSIDQNKVNQLRLPLSINSKLHKLLEQALDRYAYKGLSVQIKIDPNSTILAPELEYIHAISHLIDNACKFSPDGAKIWVAFQKIEQSGGIFTVENEGSSIPVELRQQVFDRYFQIDQGDNRRYGGLGVGLTIARAIAQANGGTVEVIDSQVGCKVQMALPPVRDRGIQAVPRLA